MGSVHRRRSDQVADRELRLQTSPVARTVAAMRIPVLVLLVSLAPACGGGADGGAGSDGGVGADAGAGADAGGFGCPRSLAPDGTRHVVVSLPYDADGQKAAAYRLLELAIDSSLTSTGKTFTMGRAVGGEIAFTPDGALALVAQEDGSVGVVAFDGAEPRVVHDAFTGDFYAQSVVMDARGDRAYILDSQWRENGGGVYTVAIDCDGSLRDLGLTVPAKLPAALLPLAGGDALLVANDALDSAENRDAHLLHMGDAPTVTASVDAFPDDEAIVSSAALTADGRYLLIADNSEFSGVDNRIAVVEVADGSLTSRQVVTPFEDPYSLLASPFGDAALAVSGYGDAIFALDYNPGDAQPFALRGELAYQGGKPMLPGDAVLIARGALTGLVLVAEVDGVRLARFEDGGAVTDLGVMSLGDGLEFLPGAIGVAP
jgi:hypothetical protein